MLQFDVVYQIRADWSEFVRCQAETANSAVTTSRKQLEEHHGKIAARWGVVKSIELVAASK